MSNDLLYRPAATATAGVSSPRDAPWRAPWSGVLQQYFLPPSAAPQLRPAATQTHAVETVKMLSAQCESQWTR
jgi:hypothetical protein